MNISKIGFLLQGSCELSSGKSTPESIGMMRMSVGGVLRLKSRKSSVMLRAGERGYLVRDLRGLQFEYLWPINFS